MGKKRCRSTKTSRKQRPSISASIVNAVRAGRSEVDKMNNKLNAWRSGKKGWVTIENPNPNETNKRFVKMSFDDYFGKGRSFKTIKMSSGTKEENTTL